MIGIPHGDLGEGVVAVIQRLDACRNLDINRLMEGLRSQLAGCKVPKEVIVVDEIPRNALGKIQKNVLEQQYGNVFFHAQKNAPA